jgi:thiamine pyrophosphokinase
MSDPAVIRSMLRPDDWIIAADGGARHALACGRPPHLVIGDMDSIPPAIRTELETQGTKFLAFPAAKDETDLELALLHAAAEGATDILVAGALGGRLDQTLANVQLLARPEIAPLHVQVVDGRLTAILINQEATIHGQAGDRISLIPLGGVGGRNPALWRGAWCEQRDDRCNGSDSTGRRVVDLHSFARTPPEMRVRKKRIKVLPRNKKHTFKFPSCGAELPRGRCPICLSTPSEMRVTADGCPRSTGQIEK